MKIRKKKQQKNKCKNELKNISKKIKTFLNKLRKENLKITINQDDKIAKIDKTKNIEPSKII